MRPLLEVDAAACQRTLCADPLVGIAKTSCGYVPQTETDDARWRGQCIQVHGLHDWGGERIGRGGRTTGNNAIRTALAILCADVPGS